MATETQLKCLAKGPKVKKTYVNAMTHAQLMKLLWQGTLSRAELAEECGFNEETVRRQISALYAIGMVHIKSWAEDDSGRFSLAIFKLGPGKDAEKPKKKPTKEQFARWRKSRADRKKQIAMQNALAGRTA